MGFFTFGRYGMKQTSFLWALVLGVGILAKDFAHSESLKLTEVSTFTLKNGTVCADCRIVEIEKGHILYKSYSLKGYYERVLRQAAANGEHYTLKKPDNSILKVSIKQISSVEINSENQRLYNLSTFSGDTAKNVSKVFTDFRGMYWIFATEEGGKITLPFKDVQYLVDAEDGRLLFNGVEVKEKLASLIQSSQELNAAAFALAGSLNQQRALSQQDQFLRQQALGNQLQMSHPRTINCNTLGSNTTCSGW